MKIDEKIVIALLITLVYPIYGCGKENTPPAIQREDYSNNAVSQEVIEEEILEKYTEPAEKENAGRMAFIYFDEDDIPELVLIVVWQIR